MLKMLLAFFLVFMLFFLLIGSIHRFTKKGVINTTKVIVQSVIAAVLSFSVLTLIVIIF